MMMKRPNTSRKGYLITTVFALGCMSSKIANGDEKFSGILKTIGEKCVVEHGYEWKNPGSVGEYELGASENELRECVYAGIRSKIVPKSKVADEYERIIEQDIAFTKAIEAGEMTRFERWQRNRADTQLLYANEKLARITEVQHKQKSLQEFMDHQLNQMLRVPPPIFVR